MTEIKKVFYNKLVRDNIPDVIEAAGGEAEIRVLSSDEFETELLKKVGEEASGLTSTENREDLIKELADLEAVIDEIRELKGITDGEIEAAKKSNFEKKGGFKKKLFLVWSEDTGYRTNEKRYSKKK
jgi:predicted house-cleaning noncanonical NTP pyrophosphatase (MazG superfamily)